MVEETEKETGVKAGAEMVPQKGATMTAKLLRRLYSGLGLFFVGLAVLGVVLPVLPTTPFLLVALWLFTKSSARLRRWLLTNRMFGKYLSDYKSGRGIPLKSKIYILALLWGTITYSALWAVDVLWVKIMLFAVAGGVTVHIMHIRTKPCRRKIIVVVPTEVESEYFAGLLPDDVEVVVGGVGMAAAGAAAARAAAGRPDMAILAGIAGAYPGSGIAVGDCVLVSSEFVADQGAFRQDGFTPLYARNIECPYVCDIQAVPSVPGCTVNAAAGSFFAPAGAVENMEGAAFFAVCEGLGVPFLEVRAVSNMTTDARADWKLDEACKALAEGLKKIIDEVRSWD